jgi:hypothetical protein
MNRPLIEKNARFFRLRPSKGRFSALRVFIVLGSNARRCHVKLNSNPVLIIVHV